MFRHLVLAVTQLKGRRMNKSESFESVDYRGTNLFKHQDKVIKVLIFTAFTHKGSGGPRALQKAPKRALKRVDPLKKRLLRISALFWVLKRVLSFFALLWRGLKKLPKRVKRSKKRPKELVSQESAQESWSFKSGGRSKEYATHKSESLKKELK